MRHLYSRNPFFQGFLPISVSKGSQFGAFFLSTAFLTTAQAAAPVNNATLQIAWEAPAKEGSAETSERKVLKEISLGDLEARKQATLSEVDPSVKGGHETAKFQGVSLSTLIDESTKALTAADRSTTDLVVLKARDGREALMPKAFLIKYPQIQVALRRNGQTLGAEAPRVVLPATTNAKIRQENMILAPLFVSELASVTLSSYERRYGNYLLKRRTDPAAMRGEKLFLQNCVSCHTQSQLAMTALTVPEKVQKVANGEHPAVSGGFSSPQEFKAVFDKKSLRSLVSYLEAFRFQTAKN